MPTQVELERMVVRFTTDLHQMSAGMKQAIAEVDATSKRIEERLEAVDRKTKQVGSSMSQHFKTIGNSATAMGRNLSLKVTAPIAAIGAVSVNAFANFDKAMTESTSIMKVTQEQTERMKKTALSLSTQGPQGPEVLARSYFFLASAGKDAEQSMALLPFVQKFATAGAFDMAKATDLLTDAQSALGLSSKEAAKDAENMARLGNVLVKANTLANASVEQFSIALTSKAGSSLKAFGKDVEEGVAVLAAFADQGIKAELAGNQFDRVLRLLASSATDPKIRKMQNELGFAVFDTAGEMRNMADIVQNLEEVLAGMSDEQRSVTLEMLGFEARVQQAVLPLLGMSQQIRDYEDKLRKAGNVTAEVSDKQMASLSNRLAVAKNRLTAVAIDIGARLVPVMEKMIGVVERGVKWWDSLHGSTKRIITVIAGVTATIGPLLIVIGTLSSTIGTLLPLMTAMATRMTAVKLASLGTAGAFTAAAVAGVSLGVWLAQFMPSMQAYNREVERAEKLNNKWAKAQQRATNNIVNDALKEQDVQKRIKILEDQLASTEQNLKGKEAQVTAAQARVDEFGAFANATGNKILEQARAEVAENERAVELLEQRRDILESTLNLQKQMIQAEQETTKFAESIQQNLQLPTLPDSTITTDVTQDVQTSQPVTVTAPAIEFDSTEGLSDSELLARIAVATEISAASVTNTVIADKVL